MSHIYDSKALELSREVLRLFIEPFPAVQLQAKIQNLFIDAMEFAAPPLQPRGEPYTLPDGWVMVPKEPTAAMYNAGDRELTTKQVWDAMLSTVPQLEVSRD